jgi:hypothetical protein
MIQIERSQRIKNQDRTKDSLRKKQNINHYHTPYKGHCTG